MIRIAFALLACFAAELWFCQALAQDASAGNTEPIEVVAPTADKAIQNRIQEIFDAVGGFEGIGISVQSGVVTLTGEVSKSSTRKDAVSLSDRTDGVVLTLDRMTEKVELTSQFAPALEKLREMGRAFVVKLPLIGASFIILLLTGFLAKQVGEHSGWIGRIPLSSLGKQLALRAVRLVIIVVGVLIVLELLDATAIVGAVIGAAGLAGLALGFAFKNIVENYLAGVLLSTRNPFEIGDAVEIDGQVGKVARLTSRDTVLVTLDGNHLRIPNAIVMNSVLLNYSRNPKRRFDFSVGVSTEFDLTEAKKIALDVLASNPGILADPKPVAVIDSLGDSSVAMKFFAWLDQTESDFLKTKSEAIRRVKEAFDQAGIEMPEPIYRVHIRDRSEEAPPRPQPASSPKPAALENVEDISVDTSIDDQIEKELKESGENLLSPESEGNG